MESSLGARHASLPSLEDRTWRDRSLRDLIAAAVLVVAGGCLFVTIDAYERLIPVALHWESAQVDDLVLTLVLAVAAAGWFSLRRWRDSVAQLEALRANANERAFYLQRLEQLSSQLLRAEQHERDRLAEVLHDHIGQTLYGCQLKLKLLAGATRDLDAAALVAQASELTATAMAHARDLSIQLSPPELHDLGLAEALEALMPRLCDRYGIALQFTPGQAWEQVPERYRAPVFHSVNELVLNAAKHGRASRVELRAALDGAGRVRVTVTDDGRGFDSRAGRGTGFGLFSIERRMACMNGAFEIESSAGLGTTAILLVSC